MTADPDRSSGMFVPAAENAGFFSGIRVGIPVKTACGSEERHRAKPL